MKKILIALVLAGVGTFAQAETPTEAYIKKTISANIGGGAKVDSVTKTPYGGLYEVRMGSEIVYTDEKAKYVFVGSIIDVKGTVNFTKQRTDELNRVNFSELPLESALKYVKGDGKRVIAIFEDPNCGYCKKFRKTLQSVDNVTIYTFMYNILAEDSAVKSRDIWCSADRSKAWDEWMMNGKVAATAPANCNAPNDKILALGKKLRVTGTPTVIFTDGSRLPGMVDVKGLEDKFASLKNPSIVAK
ncbi:DsbC family protein [Undibacterium fentianense]|uniref:Thiol:disulfide interchange protein n=1 Tax=Undibacterium fentianense TaxID=2828728 RepID=A0A941IEJ6_9BURK|nr:DsbC family protein [Undibacterium fentianense]MBR7799696.1 DsbC family protein [Undibacterium fentianense]